MSSSEAVAAFQFSKKNLLIRLLDPKQFQKWDKILVKIGATRTNSTDDPGWLLLKSKEDEFNIVVAEYGSRKQHKHKRRSSGSSAAASERKGSRFRESSSSNDTKVVRDNKDDRHVSEESDDDSEDELIQNVLARRVMSESSHKSITIEDIENSDDEDVVSYARRLRHIYTVIKNQRDKIAMLEEQLNKTRE